MTQTLIHFCTSTRSSHHSHTASLSSLFNPPLSFPPTSPSPYLDSSAAASRTNWTAPFSSSSPDPWCLSVPRKASPASAFPHPQTDLGSATVQIEAAHIPSTTGCDLSPVVCCRDLLSSLFRARAFDYHLRRKYQQPKVSRLARAASSTRRLLSAFVDSITNDINGAQSSIADHSHATRSLCPIQLESIRFASRRASLRAPPLTDPVVVVCCHLPPLASIDFGCLAAGPDSPP